MRRFLPWLFQSRGVRPVEYSCIGRVRRVASNGDDPLAQNFSILVELDGVEQPERFYTFVANHMSARSLLNYLIVGKLYRVTYIQGNNDDLDFDVDGELISAYGYDYE